MKHALPALAAGILMLALAWFLPALLDGSVLAQWMLPASELATPEFVADRYPALREAFQAALLRTALIPLVGYLAWLGALQLLRPTGPRQAGNGGRMGLWVALLVAVGAAVFLIVRDSSLGDTDVIDPVAAVRIGLTLALLAMLWFWVLSLLGTERMMRPAVPLAIKLTVRA